MIENNQIPRPEQIENGYKVYQTAVIVDGVRVRYDASSERKCTALHTNDGISEKIEFRRSHHLSRTQY